MKKYERRFDFKRDDTNVLARKYYNKNYSFYKEKLYEMLIMRIERKLPHHISKDLLRFIRREKLKRIWGSIKASLFFIQ